jgi:hypothetical protein
MSKATKKKDANYNRRLKILNAFENRLNSPVGKITKYGYLLLLVFAFGCSKTYQSGVPQTFCWHCQITPYRGGRTIQKDTCIKDSAFLSFQDADGHNLFFVCAKK